MDGLFAPSLQPPIPLYYEIKAEKSDIFMLIKNQSRKTGSMNLM